MRGCGIGADACPSDRVESLVRVEYLTEEGRLPEGVVLRRGEAGFVRTDPEDPTRLETPKRLTLSVNTTHALLGHGVIDELDRLPIQGRVASGLQVLIPPAQLEPVRDVLYRADAKTYGAEYEFVVGSGVDEAVEYRIRIDNREYQHALSGLQFLLRTAANEGMAAWLRVS